jgi:hypothetical protein
VQSLKGKDWEASSLSVMANAYMSDALLWGCFCSTSGAMYSRVPTCRVMMQELSCCVVLGSGSDDDEQDSLMEGSSSDGEWSVLRVMHHHLHELKATGNQLAL